MARVTLGGAIDRTYDSPRDVSGTVARLLDRERIAASTAEAEAHALLPPDRVEIRLREQGALGHTFRGTYTLAVAADGGTVTWTPVAGNMRNDARLEVTPSGAGARVRWMQSIFFDHDLPFLVHGPARALARRRAEDGLDDLARRILAR
jgi:hypothetical protein